MLIVCPGDDCNHAAVLFPHKDADTALAGDNIKTLTFVLLLCSGQEQPGDQPDTINNGEVARAGGDQGTLLVMVMAQLSALCWSPSANHQTL